MVLWRTVYPLKITKVEQLLTKLLFITEWYLNDILDWINIRCNYYDNEG